LEIRPLNASGEGAGMGRPLPTSLSQRRRGEDPPPPPVKGWQLPPVRSASGSFSFGFVSFIF